MTIDLFCGAGGYSPLRTEEVVAAMPPCQDLSLAGTRSPDFRTNADPAGVEALIEEMSKPLFIDCGTWEVTR